MCRAAHSIKWNWGILPSRIKKSCSLASSKTSLRLSNVAVIPVGLHPYLCNWWAGNPTIGIVTKSLRGQYIDTWVLASHWANFLVLTGGIGMKCHGHPSSPLAKVLIEKEIKIACSPICSQWKLLKIGSTPLRIWSDQQTAWRLDFEPENSRVNRRFNENSVSVVKNGIESLSNKDHWITIQWRPVPRFTL